MAVTTSKGRQSAIVAEASFVFGGLTDATAMAAVQVPVGATVVGGEVVVDTVWNSATTDVADVGDGSDANRYTANQIDFTVLGRTKLTLTGHVYTAADWIDITWNGTGAVPTTGAGRLIVQYMIPGRKDLSENIKLTKIPAKALV